MATVGCEIGVTLHIGTPERNEYLRFTLRADGIDAEQPVGTQMDSIKAALNEVVGVLETGLERKIQEELGRQI